MSFTVNWLTWVGCVVFLWYWLKLSITSVGNSNIYWLFTPQMRVRQQSTLNTCTTIEENGIDWGRAQISGDQVRILLKCLHCFIRILFILQWNLWRGDTSKSVPTWQVSPRHRYISMLKYILVHRKCNLDIPISTFKCPLVTGFTVITNKILQFFGLLNDKLRILPCVYEELWCLTTFLWGWVSFFNFEL